MLHKTPSSIAVNAPTTKILDTAPSFGVASIAGHTLSPLTLAIRAALIGAGVCFGLGGAHAATIVVTNNTDTTSACSLRNAIRSVNAGANVNGCANASGVPFGTDDTITFENPGTIVFSGGEGQLEIEKSVSINASTVSGITIDANANSRVMFVEDNQSLTLTNLTITGGNGGDGAGVYFGSEYSTGGNLTIVDSTITGNQSSSFGGGLHLGAYTNTNISNSDISDNIAGSDGGAIYMNQGDNEAFSTLTLTNSRIINNVATDDEGGGIWSNGYANSVTLIDSVVNNNTSGSEGGGIFMDEGTLVISNTTISGNSSVSHGGGVYTESDSIVTVLNSTISGNSTAAQGGGIYSSGESLTISNSTISSNTASGVGGGIRNKASATLTNSTITNNVSGLGGAGIESTRPLVLINSIVANSSGGIDCNSSGTTNVDAQSIIEDGSCGSRSGDPGLLPLANNGGRTLTHALAEDSIAINTGDNATCLARDQRGEFRNDKQCDVGSFEFKVDDDGFVVIPLANGKVVVIPN